MPWKRQLRHDADNSPPISTKVKNECSCTSGTQHIPSWHNSNEPSKNNLVCNRTPKIYNSGLLKFSYMTISLKFQQFLPSAIFLSDKQCSTLNRVWDKWSAFDQHVAQNRMTLHLQSNIPMYIITSFLFFYPLLSNLNLTQCRSRLQNLTTMATEISTCQVT